MKDRSRQVAALPRVAVGERLAALRACICLSSAEPPLPAYDLHVAPFDLSDLTCHVEAFKQQAALAVATTHIFMLRHHAHLIMRSRQARTGQTL